MATRPSAVCRRGYVKIRGQIGHPTHPCLEKKHDGVEHDGCHPLHGAHQAIPRPWFESHQQRVDGEESADYQDETIDACHWIVGIVLKKTCALFMCNRRGKSCICKILLQTTEPDFNVRHVSSCAWTCIEPRSGMFRLLKGHVSRLG